MCIRFRNNLSATGLNTYLSPDTVYRVPTNYDPKSSPIWTLIAADALLAYEDVIRNHPTNTTLADFHKKTVQGLIVCAKLDRGKEETLETIRELEEYLKTLDTSLHEPVAYSEVHPEILAIASGS